jgi:hypothetical protein
MAHYHVVTDLGTLPGGASSTVPPTLTTKVVSYPQATGGNNHAFGTLRRG